MENNAVLPPENEKDDPKIGDNVIEKLTTSLDEFKKIKEENIMILTTVERTSNTSTAVDNEMAFNNVVLTNERLEE